MRRRVEAQNDTAVMMYFLMLSGRYNCDQAARTCAEWAKP